MSEWPEVIELKGYTPKPGDVLFMTIKNGDISPATVERLHHQFQEMVPGVKVVILCGGSTIEVPS